MKLSTFDGRVFQKPECWHLGGTPRESQSRCNPLHSKNIYYIYLCMVGDLHTPLYLYIVGERATPAKHNSGAKHNRRQVGIFSRIIKMKFLFISISNFEIFLSQISSKCSNFEDSEIVKITRVWFRFACLTPTPVSSYVSMYHICTFPRLFLVGN